MRESDLKLEKMAALIPTKTARKEVDRYFAQKRKERESSNKVGVQGKKAATTSAKNNPAKTNSADQLKLF